MRKSSIFLLTGLSLLMPVKVWPQKFADMQNQLKFRHITIDNGLSHNRVNAICQDQNGYIWLATVYGLNRYNGIDVKVYNYAVNDSFSLISNILYAVYCDSRGRIWVGTNNGLCYYNEFADGFSAFRPKELPEFDGVYDILEDEKQHLWFATLKGLILYIPEKDSVVCFNRRSYNR